MVKVLIADDHGIVRTGLRLLFEKMPDMEVVGEAVDGVHKTTDENDAGHPLERPDRGLDVGEGVECTDLGGLVGRLHGLLLAHLANVGHLPADHADGAGAIEQVSGAHGGHVAAGGGRGIRERRGCASGRRFRCWRWRGWQGG